MTEEGKTYNRIAGQRIQRIEAISDGVFSIAMTLLVLDIKVPHDLSIKTESDLIASLYKLLPSMLSYFLSFMTIGIFWTGQSTQYHFIERSDRRQNWLALFFLMFISLLPFTTAFLSEHIEFRTAVLIYWFNIFALGVTIYLHWHYASKHDHLTLTGDQKILIDRAIKRRVIIAQLLYVIGAALCFVNTYLSIGAIILVQLNYALGIISERVKGKKEAS